MDMTMDTRVRLWDAINRYVQTCGGDPSKYVYGNIARMNAVVDVEQVFRDAAPVEPERTPETVLRAMLRAYEAERERQSVAYLRGTPDGAMPAAMRLAARGSSDARGAAEDVRWMLFNLLAGKPVCAEPHVVADYQARLAGTRPLNAPPLEV